MARAGALLDQFSQMVIEGVVTARAASYQGTARPIPLLHEGGDVLGEGCAYCTRAPPLLSTPEPCPVVPDPRAVPAAATATQPSHHVRPHCRAGSGLQRLPMAASSAICSVTASLSWRMRAASACLPAHSRTDA